MNISQIKIDKRDLLTVSIFGFFLSTLLWLQISPITFNNYQTICSTEHPAKTEAFNKCMDPYWSQYFIDRAILIITLVISALALLALTAKSLTKK